MSGFWQRGLIKVSEGVVEYVWILTRDSGTVSGIWRERGERAFYQEAERGTVGDMSDSGGVLNAP